MHYFLIYLIVCLACAWGLAELYIRAPELPWHD